MPVDYDYDEEEEHPRSRKKVEAPVQCIHCEFSTGWGDDETCSLEECCKGGRNDKQHEKWVKESGINIWNRFCPVIKADCYWHLGFSDKTLCRYCMVDTAVINVCPLNSSEEKKRLTKYRRKRGGVERWGYDND